ncbi:hypothetical protein HK096_006594 [Nowakowskiella sp. JEL0078]|nr:hypothetical protein HK096_006594 [Nowakowskiella sp. JEL0078]
MRSPISVASSIPLSELESVAEEDFEFVISDSKRNNSNSPKTQEFETTNFYTSKIESDNEDYTPPMKQKTVSVVSTTTSSSSTWTSNGRPIRDSRNKAPLYKKIADNVVAQNIPTSFGKIGNEQQFCLSPHLSKIRGKQWMKVLRSASRTRPTIFNNIDDEEPPLDFQWIEANRYPPDISLSELSEFAVGCDCSENSDCLTDCSCPTAMLADVVANYNHKGQVHSSSDIILIECNPAKCSCSPLTCGNRVVQTTKPPAMQLRRLPYKGWGVIARERIPRGTFVAEYTGEIIRIGEAEKRAERLAAAKQSTYLFFLDKGRDAIGEDTFTQFAIDAKNLGNITRFFNHSCDANMAKFAICYHHQDASLHSIAFFTRRDIEEGEELCFDYLDTEMEAMKRKRRKRTEEERGVCCCGAANCKRLFLGF